MLCMTIRLVVGMVELLVIRPAADRERSRAFRALDGEYAVSFWHRPGTAAAAAVRRGRLEVVAADGQVEGFALVVDPDPMVDLFPFARGPMLGRQFPRNTG